MVDGRVRGRRLREPGDQRALGERELVEVLAEVAARRRRDAPRAVAEVDLVEVDREDRLLRVGRLEAARHDRFLRLARQRLLGAEELLRDLLRDRRAALREVAGGDVRPRGADDALPVDAAVVPVVVVLDRDERVDELLRDLARTARTRATPSRTRRAACRRRRRCARRKARRAGTRRGRGSAACAARSSCRAACRRAATATQRDQRGEPVELADPVQVPPSARLAITRARRSRISGDSAAADTAEHRSQRRDSSTPWSATLPAMRRALILLGITALACRDKEAPKPPPPAPAPATAATACRSAAPKPRPPTRPPELPAFGSGVGSAARSIAGPVRGRRDRSVVEVADRGRPQAGVREVKHPPSETECHATLCRLTIAGSETDSRGELDELQALREPAQSLAAHGAGEERGRADRSSSRT